MRLALRGIWLTCVVFPIFSGLSPLRPPAALAWTNLPVNSILQFNFQNPGARALAMGGAFIGLAEDASAVRSNPAGLVTLSRAQLGLELRRTSLTSNYAAYGGDESGTLLDRDFQKDVFDLGYGSVVLPVYPFALAVFTHRLVHFEAEVEAVGATFRNIEGPIPAAHVRLFPSTSDTEIGINTYGAAFAHQIGRFSYGITAGFNTFQIDSTTNSFAIDFLPDTIPPEDPDFSRDNVAVIHFQRGKDTAFGYSVGLRYARPRFGAGLVYRAGLEFDYDVIQQKGPQALPEIASFEQTTSFSVPEAYGGGLFVRPLSPAGRFLDFTVSADLLRVAYSQLAREFDPVFRSADEDYGIDDVTELHVGMEWIFNLSEAEHLTPVAVRLGYWRDPEHRLEYRGGTATNTQKGLHLLFPESERIYHHVTFGFGVVFTETLQLDIGADLSENFSTSIISIVARR